MRTADERWIEFAFDVSNYVSSLQGGILLKQITFTIPRPKSKKNNMLYGKGRIFKAKGIEDAEFSIALIAKLAAQQEDWEMGWQGPVSLQLQWIKETDEVKCILTQLERKRPERARRFDLQNLPEVICDAIEASGVIANDKQISTLVISEI